MPWNFVPAVVDKRHLGQGEEGRRQLCSKLSAGFKFQFGWHAKTAAVSPVGQHRCDTTFQLEIQDSATSCVLHPVQQKRKQCQYSRRNTDLPTFPLPTPRRLSRLFALERGQSIVKNGSWLSWGSIPRAAAVRILRELVRPCEEYFAAYFPPGNCSGNWRRRSPVPRFPFSAPPLNSAHRLIARPVRVHH
jgi:hypothetical protein